MDSRMEYFQNNGFEYGSGTLEFDVPLLEIKAEAGKEYKGKFQILVHSEHEVSGSVYTTDYRIECPKGGFKGKNLEVPFIFDTTGMERGDKAKGEFYIISNLGEYYLPYEVQIENVSMNSELGEIKNLFHFANLAKVNWNEALDCFYDEKFIDILNGSGRQYVEVYQALSQEGRKEGNRDFAMEQFLVLIKKKQPVTFECPVTEFSYSKEEVPDTVEIEIHKNGWGYTGLSLSTEGSFITGDVQILKETDFVNNTAVVKINVDRQKLHRGKNTAGIRLQSEMSSILCKILVENDEGISKDKKRLAKRQTKQLTDLMMRLYLDYRTGRKSGEECEKIASGVLEYVRGTNALMPALYDIHMKLLMGQENVATWLLKHAKRMMADTQVPLSVYCYYLYLASMAKGEDGEQADAVLNQYRKQYPDKFIIYWGYMHKENLRKENPGNVYRTLKELWEKGCFSPILYLEAAMVVLENPALFTIMDVFEIQLLLFMERYELITEEFAGRIYTAAESAKDYYPELVALMKKYPAENEEKMLKAMCLQYMRGGCVGKEAAKWFEKGILRDCRITGLYEAYVRALEFDSRAVLPQEAVRYFAFDTSLDEGHLAYVYEKVIRQQEELKPEYEEKIRRFVIKQMMAGRIDASLAYLYRNILMPEDMDSEMQEQLLKLVFAGEVVVRQKDFKYCIVRHGGIKKQERFPVKGGRAVVMLYSEDYVLLFEDENGLCRYLETGYEVRPLMGFERMKRLLKNCEMTNFGVCFHKCAMEPLEGLKGKEDFEAAEKVYRWLLTREELTERFRHETAGKLLHAYVRFELWEELDDYLQSLDIQDFEGKDRAEFISILCERGFYKKAFSYACAYGCERVERKIMARLCQVAIEDAEGGCDEKLVNLVYRVFESGKYTETMIKYLVVWFRGTVKQMRDVWKAAVSMEIDALPMAERILEQILFTDAYTSDRGEIFAYYSERGGRGELVRLFLSMRAREYLVRGETVEEELFLKLENYMSEGGDFLPEAGAAVLKYNSVRISKLTDEKKQLCKTLLEESLKKGIYFSFFEAYKKLCPEVEIYGEKSYIDYHTKPDAKVIIHYILDKGNGEDGDYCTEEMREIYPGIYQKEFRLFFGEQLQYYVTEGYGEEEQFVMSGNLEQSGVMSENGLGKYRLLNDILLSMEMHDYATADVLVKEYAQNEYLTAKMLRIQ